MICGFSALKPFTSLQGDHNLAPNFDRILNSCVLFAELTELDVPIRVTKVLSQHCNAWCKGGFLVRLIWVGQFTNLPT
ncbi:unnamed protein product [Calypogeia fissa]